MWKRSIPESCTIVLPLSALGISVCLKEAALPSSAVEARLAGVQHPTEFIKRRKSNLTTRSRMWFQTCPIGSGFKPKNWLFAKEYCRVFGILAYSSLMYLLYLKIHSRQNLLWDSLSLPNGRTLEMNVASYLLWLIRR